MVKRVNGEKEYIMKILFFFVLIFPTAFGL